MRSWAGRINTDPLGSGGSERDESNMRERDEHVVVIGAGPAGLTAALELVERGVPTTVLEGDDVVGGISRTVHRDDWHFDIGGHRFFTKVSEVEKRWWNVLGADDFLVRPRMSRIRYKGRFFDYPLKAMNALRGLGVIEATRCVLSYAWARARPPADQTHFEGWVSARFGRRLYGIFFKTYTEKVWGVPGDQLAADWAAQRIKNLSLGRAVIDTLRPTSGRRDVASLIEEFHYPRLGPGMMWERAAAILQHAGTSIEMSAPVTELHHCDGKVNSVAFERDGVVTSVPSTSVVSSMPLGELVLAMRPPAPDEVRAAAAALTHRDFLTVALVVPEDAGFPDNWIYIHEPQVRVGRIQNYGAWSPEMVKPGTTCLGLEYFVSIGDDLWEMDDDGLVELATAELGTLGLVDVDVVSHGYVVRMPKAYPVYDAHYTRHVDTLRAWLAETVVNVIPAGRNGMHKYNNQDHSMLTAVMAVENLVDGADNDIWSVNVEEEYLEEDRGRQGASGQGTGRAAPVLPSASA